MCLYPKLIRNRKYTKTKKNGGNVPPITDERTTLVPVGCGNCMECRKQKAREWQVRLLEDIKHNRNGKFITLTFTNEKYAELCKKYPNLSGYTLDNAVGTLAVKLFRERYRKEYGKSIRHWLVTELGHNGTENIHLHGIIWTDISLEKVEKIWQYGFMWKGQMKNGKLTNYINDKTITYITKYVSKTDTKHKHYKSIILTSPGIGSDYTKTYNSKLNKYNETETIETYRTSTGHKIAMPIYWRNKIYKEEEREKLWLQKLDKQIRYINGKKFDVSKTDEHYMKALKYEQQLNKELGYGDDQKNFNEEIYENQLRILKQKERIYKAYNNKNKYNNK